MQVSPSSSEQSLEWRSSSSAAGVPRVPRRTISQPPAWPSLQPATTCSLPRRKTDLRIGHAAIVQDLPAARWAERCS